MRKGKKFVKAGLVKRVVRSVKRFGKKLLRKGRGFFNRKGGVAHHRKLSLTKHKKAVKYTKRAAKKLNKGEYLLRLSKMNARKARYFKNLAKRQKKLAIKLGVEGHVWDSKRHLRKGRRFSRIRKRFTRKARSRKRAARNHLRKAKSYKKSAKRLAKKAKFHSKLAHKALTRKRANSRKVYAKKAKAKKVFGRKALGRKAHGKKRKALGRRRAHGRKRKALGRRRAFGRRRTFGRKIKARHAVSKLKRAVKHLKKIKKIHHCLN